MIQDLTPFSYLTNEEFLGLVRQTNAPIEESLINRLEILMEAYKEAQKELDDLKEELELVSEDYKKLYNTLLSKY